jgi:nitrite reductase (NADH) small subunit
MAEGYKVARVSDVPEGRVIRVEIAGRVLALAHAGGAFHAVADRCPHRGGPLSEGTLEGCKLTCPWHGWTFDVSSGARVGFPPGIGSITTFVVRVEGEDVIVECPAS